MRILLLTHSFNSLTQRLFVELEQMGHTLSIEFDVNDEVSLEAAQLFRPDLIIAPFLKRRIPDVLWRNVPCWVIHPGIKGDRGPSALDWAILRNEPRWGVTVLQADQELDAGDVWAAVEFPMRAASKSSLYRNEVTETAVAAVREGLEKLARGEAPEPLGGNGIWRPRMTQRDRRIDWGQEDSAAVLRKIRAGDGFPGTRDTLLGLDCFLYNGLPEAELRGTPGAVIATRNGAVCIACRGGAVWITHLRGKDGFKLPAQTVLAGRLGSVPDLSVEPGASGDLEIRVETAGDAAFLHFEFYNGAMSSERCERLRRALHDLKHSRARVIVLFGGRDFWSNGIDLNAIEHSDRPAEASLENIEAMNDLVLEMLQTPDQLVISALRGNAGAGGVFLALAADRIWARSGIILNPHYKNMGNLYGSEYWTYLLPKRLGLECTKAVMQNRLPLGAAQAKREGLVDEVFGESPESFVQEVQQQAMRLAAQADYPALLEDKRARRSADERVKPLADYRAAELERMRLNFFGFDPSYHVARHNFVHKIPHSRTPLHLARHRQKSGRSTP